MPDLKDMSDEELIQRFHSTGNASWVGHLYKRYTHKLYGLCLHFFKSQADAEDALMEIYLLVQKRLTRSPIDNFRPWLQRVARNYCVKTLQHRANAQSDDSAEIFSALFMENGEFDPLYTVEERYTALSQSVEALNTEQKTCIVLFFFQQKSYQEIADFTNYSIKEIKSYLQNGKRNLRIKMNQWYADQA